MAAKTVNSNSQLPSTLLTLPPFLAPSLPLSLPSVNGGWTLPKRSVTMPDPLNGQPFLQMPDTTTEELGPYIDSLKSVPKSGLHNPFKVGGREGGRERGREWLVSLGPLLQLKLDVSTIACRLLENPSRYLLYGDISAKAAQGLRDPTIRHSSFPPSLPPSLPHP